MSTVSYSAAHIEDRVRQVQKLRIDISTFQKQLLNQSSSAKKLLSDHLWADVSILPELSESLQQAIQHTEKLLLRADKLIKGFNELPREKDDVEIFAEVGDVEVLEGELCD